MFQADGRLSLPYITEECLKKLDTKQQTNTLLSLVWRDSASEEAFTLTACICHTLMVQQRMMVPRVRHVCPAHCLCLALRPPAATASCRAWCGMLCSASIPWDVEVSVSPKPALTVRGLAWGARSALDTLTDEIRSFPSYRRAAALATTSKAGLVPAALGRCSTPVRVCVPFLSAHLWRSVLFGKVRGRYRTEGQLRVAVGCLCCWRCVCGVTGTSMNCFSGEEAVSEVDCAGTSSAERPCERRCGS